MSDMKYSLPGQEVVTISGQTIDKLIRAGDGDAALLYLHILKTHGQSTSEETVSALGKNKGWVASALAVLSRLGLVKIDGSSASGPPPEIPQEEPLEAPRSYTTDEMKRELMEGSDFALVVEETQRSLGKVLSPDDLLRLYGIYDALRLPPEVILQLITHCIRESRLSGGGRAPSMRYIEKAAFTWEREGVVTLEKAEEYIKTLEERRSLRGEIKRALQIKDREFSATEKRYVDSWIDMGIEAGAIAIAYDKTLVKTGKMVWGYMDSIMKSWHSKGIHTAIEALEKDKWPGRDSAYEKDKTGGKKFGSPNQEEIERMQRILDKIKDEKNDKDDKDKK